MDKAAAAGLVPKLDGAQVLGFGFGRFHDRERRPLTAEERLAVTSFWQDFFRRDEAADVAILVRLD